MDATIREMSNQKIMHEYEHITNRIQISEEKGGTANEHAYKGKLKKEILRRLNS